MMEALNTLLKDVWQELSHSYTRLAIGTTQTWNLNLLQSQSRLSKIQTVHLLLVYNLIPTQFLMVRGWKCHPVKVYFGMMLVVTLCMSQMQSTDKVAL